jgi:sigma-B regulation protein RsbU (phosphoserine phosphatase)
MTPILSPRAATRKAGHAPPQSNVPWTVVAAAERLLFVRARAACACVSARKAQNQRMNGVALPMPTSPVERLREGELEEARSLQLALVAVEPVRGEAVEVASKYRPYAAVSGDFLDMFWLSDMRLGFYLGDVVGKGLPAAMYAALAVGTLRGVKKTGEEPKDVLELLNRRLGMRMPPSRYCAVQYGVFDPATRRLRYTNAGLPRPVHITAAGARELGEGGLPSGLFPHTRYDSQAAQLSPGDSVLFTTDGVIEAQNPAGDEFGVEGLLAVCAGLYGQPAHVALERLFRAVDDFALTAPQHDDMTAVVLKLT